MTLQKQFAVSLAFGLCLFLAGDVWAAGGETVSPGSCAFSAFAGTAPAYYGIELVPTKNVPGTYRSSGVGHVSFASSPFSVSVTSGGSYVHDLEVEVDHLPPASKGAYVTWVSTPTVDKIERLGPLGEDRRLTGTVDWNKFLVIVTLEAQPDESAERWQGPIVLRGLSRSGLMHTMAGHGPFSSEPCFKYGY